MTVETIAKSRLGHFRWCGRRLRIVIVRSLRDECDARPPRRADTTARYGTELARTSTHTLRAAYKQRAVDTCMVFTRLPLYLYCSI